MKKSALNRDLCLTLNRGDVEAAKKLIAQGADVNATSRATADSTLLWLTVKAAGQEISKHFRELGSGLAEFLPNVPERDHAAERTKELRILRMLIEAKADVNKPSHGSTPLRIAVHWEDLEVVKLLLANGANPNAESFSILSSLAHKTKPGYYNTVLHEAVEKRSLPIVEALGTDPRKYGVEFQGLIEGFICDNVPAIKDWLWVEPRVRGKKNPFASVGGEVGDVYSNGIGCAERKTAHRPGGNIPRPDFIISPGTPRLEDGTTRKGLLIGDFKLSGVSFERAYLGRNAKQKGQWNAITGYASRHSYTHTALFVSLRGMTPPIRNRLIRAGLTNPDHKALIIPIGILK